MNSETPAEQSANQPQIQTPNPPSIKPPEKPNEFPWFGIVLILLGFLFLAQQFGNFSFDNWWALFILIPAFSAFGSAYGIWRKAGRITFGAWTTFYGGLFPLLVALIFLFDMDWGDYWPLFVMLGGFSLLVSGLPIPRPEDDKTPQALLSHRPWMVFVGLSALLLGFVFLRMNLTGDSTFPYFDFENWWGLFILIPALGGLVTAVLLAIGRHSIVLVFINLALAAVVTLTGVIALLGLDWKLMNMTTPIILILVGIGLIVGFGGREDQNDM
jgi:hypothetical protein